MDVDKSVNNSKISDISDISEKILLNNNDKYILQSSAYNVNNI